MVRRRVWFGAACWIAFTLHAVAAVAYLSARPTAAGRPQRPHARATA